jgi:phosphatidylinositol phospholipase C delta
MIRETFGDLLYVPSSDTLNEFPSPEALMKRIIISTKPPEEFKEFLKAQGNQNESEKAAKLAEEVSLKRADSNADDSDGKVCNTFSIWKHALISKSKKVIK